VTITQLTLHDHAARQIRLSRPDLAVRPDTSGLIQAYREITATQPDEGTAVVCVVRRFDPASFIRASCAFAAGLTPAQASAWRRSFTRTIFLAGNPRNLADRFAFAHVSEDGLTAWTEPSTMDDSAALRRLLKLFQGPRHLPPWPVLRIAVPGPTMGIRRDLYLTTDGVSVADCLVHLNHLVADAVLDRLITAGDLLTLRQVPRLIGISQTLERVRVGLDRINPDRLRAYAGLSKGDAAAGGRAA
jgi:hypothetical protein